MNYSEVTDTERYYAGEGSPIKKYADNVLFSNAQLEVIRYGLECGLDVSVYANPDIPVNIMTALFNHIKIYSNEYIVRYRGETDTEVCVYEITCRNKSEALALFARSHDISTVIDVRDKAEGVLREVIPPENAPSGLLVHYKDDKLVFMRRIGSRLSEDFYMPMSISQARDLLIEIKGAVESGSRSVFVGSYTVYINCDTMENLNMHVVEHCGNNCNDVATFGYSGYSGYKTILEGIQSMIVSLSSQIENLK